ncbi:hypothetical protein BFX06_10090 [Sulfobacillus thermosulfidooxidans]|nr:hypothetical protein BFX05_07500 [Sulfobacillus thermosulfidooxidans]OLZ12914.1 hypothetical protein BFX06_10090 [Sulfobacillus thermosulfidooxidans]OLZ20913.1 hypothetical protein BFX07_14085 [Sulfobacillus thermosulfidooxidans]
MVVKVTDVAHGFPLGFVHDVLLAQYQMSQILDVSRSGYYPWRHRPTGTQAQTRRRRVEWILKMLNASG